MSNVQRPLSASLAPGTCRILRSPSHDSVTTDLSLLSVSSLSEAVNQQLGTTDHRSTSGKQRLYRNSRGSSPIPDSIALQLNRPHIIRETMWLEESNDLIRSCGQLSSLLGIQKSFSTSDITQLPTEKIFDLNCSRNGGGGGSNCGAPTSYADFQSGGSQQLRHALSEMALNAVQRCGYMLDTTRLDHTSRSCSTWVAVGELASTSQLPSPHGGPVLNVNTSSSQQQLTASNAASSFQSSQPTFTTADLIRSVNKKVRQNYIRSRLLTTYRAIERLSQSEFNLDQLEAAAVAATVLVPGPGPTELIVPITNPSTILSSSIKANVDPMTGGSTSANVVDLIGRSNEGIPSELSKSIVVMLPTPSDATEIDDKQAAIGSTTSTAIPFSATVAKPTTVPLICPQLKNKITVSINRNLTINDIEKERGRPLSKYDRNMMIFNWLHSLDETSTAED